MHLLGLEVKMPLWFSCTPIWVRRGGGFICGIYQLDVYIAAVKRTQTGVRMCRTPNKNHMSRPQSLQSLLPMLMPPSPQLQAMGEKHGSWKIEKHMWLANKFHMHSVYPHSPPPLEPPSSPTQPSHIHTLIQEGSHTQGDVKTISGGSSSGQQAVPSRVEKENRDVWRGGWDNGNRQKGGGCRLASQHGARTMPVPGTR